MTTASIQFHQAAQTTSLIHQSYSEYAKKFDLNYNELVVLYALVSAPVCTQKYICQTWALPKQTVHNICKKWIEDGFIQVLDYQEDKREKRLTLSEKGSAFALPIIEHLMALENAIIEQFGAENMAEFLRYFNQLQNIIALNLGAKS